jgi:hypothetical protein
LSEFCSTASSSRFQQPERVVGFFSTYRHLHPVSRDILRGAAEQFQLWGKEQADKWNAPIVEPPSGRRDEFVDPYFKGAGPDQVIVILKARETRADHDRNRRQEAQPLASSDRRPLDRAGQLLYLRHQ